MTPRTGDDLGSLVAALTQRIGAVEHTVSERSLHLSRIEKQSDERHKENTDEIEKLRRAIQGGIEKMTDSFQNAMEKMSDRFERSMDKNMGPMHLTQERHGDAIKKLELKWAYMAGVAFMGSICGELLFKLVVNKGHF